MVQLIIIETLYLILIVLPTLFVFFKTRKLYEFSKYKGLRFFSSAFLALSAGFLVRYAVMVNKVLRGSLSTIQTFDLFTLVMESLIVLSGLLLLYSQLWKKVEKEHYNKFSFYELGIYVLAIVISFGDMLLKGFYLMYSSQIIVYFASAIITFKKYKKRKNNSMQLYFISMILFLIVWTINLVAQYTIDTFPVIRLYAYLFTVAGAMTLAFITLRLTSDLDE